VFFPAPGDPEHPSEIEDPEHKCLPGRSLPSRTEMMMLKSTTFRKIAGKPALPVAGRAFLLLLLLATLPGWSAGQTAAGAKPWDEAAGLQTFCADTLDSSARIFDSPDYQRQLVVPGNGASAFVLDLKPKTVQVVPRAALAWDSEDRVIPDLAQAADGGSFERVGDLVLFTAGDVNWKIAPEPPLVGRMSLEDLLQAKPDYAHAAAKYTPDEESVQRLQAVSAPTEIVVFFGTWCSYCKHWLPRFIKTLEVAQNPSITAEFIGMSDDQVEPRDLIGQYNISQTPSFIVLQGGKEIGRIEEKPDVSMEADLAMILGAH